MTNKSSKKPQLEIRQSRIFSTEFKKKIVQQLLNKFTTIKQVSNSHQVSYTSIYRWIYEYSDKEKSSILVVQMDSEQTKNILLQNRISELERAVGQKQLELDFLNKLIELSSQELGFDIKKNFNSTQSNGTEIKKK